MKLTQTIAKIGIKYCDFHFQQRKLLFFSLSTLQPVLPFLFCCYRWLKVHISWGGSMIKRQGFQTLIANLSMKRGVVGVLWVFKGGFKLEATCMWQGNLFWNKHYTKWERIWTLGHSLLVKTLLSPLGIVKWKKLQCKQKHPLHFVFKVETKLNLFGTRFRGRVLFLAEHFQEALPGRDAENCLKWFL